MSMKQYGKMTKASLVRKIMKALKKLPKTKLVKLCYQLEKKKLPKLTARRAYTKPKINYLTSTKSFQEQYMDNDWYLRGNRRNPKRKKTRSAKQRANDKRLGLMAKRRAGVRRR